MTEFIQVEVMTCYDLAFDQFCTFMIGHDWSCPVMNERTVMIGHDVTFHDRS